MKAVIAKGKARGRITVPSSKSVAHRLLICAAMTDGVTVIDDISPNDDISATVDCLNALGIETKISPTSITVYGTGGRFSQNKRTLPCRESGSTLRFMIPIALTDGIETTFTGSGRLFERPMSVYENICRAGGIAWKKTGGSITVRGKLRGGDYHVPGDISSQFITGLMLALPHTENDSSIILTSPLESGSYVGLTVEALEKFGFEIGSEDGRYIIKGGQKGVSPGKVSVPGDESGAAFFGILASLGGDIVLDGLDPDTRQGDRIWRDHANAIRNGFCTVSLADCPDLAPILIVAAALSEGAEFTDTARLKYKESDRGAAVAEELAKCGVDITVRGNSITVPGGGVHAPKEDLDSHNDHRIAMALAVLSTVTGGTVNGAEAVAKSMPGFWDMLKELNIDVKLTDNGEQ